MDVLRQKRQLAATTLGKTVERGTEFNPVNQITVPTNVYCSPGGECYLTSRKCEGLMNVPMDDIGKGVRVCAACSETDNEVDNVVMGALETIKSLHFAPSSALHESMRSSVVVAQAAAHRLIARKPMRGGMQ